MTTIGHITRFGQSSHGTHRLSVQVTEHVSVLVEGRGSEDQAEMVRVAGSDLMLCPTCERSYRASRCRGDAFAEMVWAAKRARDVETAKHRRAEAVDEAARRWRGGAERTAALSAGTEHRRATEAMTTMSDAIIHGTCEAVEDGLRARLAEVEARALVAEATLASVREVLACGPTDDVVTAARLAKGALGEDAKAVGLVAILDALGWSEDSGVGPVEWARALAEDCGNMLGSEQRTNAVFAALRERNVRQAAEIDSLRAGLRALTDIRDESAAETHRWRERALAAEADFARLNTAMDELIDLTEKLEPLVVDREEIGDRTPDEILEVAIAEIQRQSRVIDDLCDGTAVQRLQVARARAKRAEDRCVAYAEELLKTRALGRHNGQRRVDATLRGVEAASAKLRAERDRATEETKALRGQRDDLVVELRRRTEDLTAATERLRTMIENLDAVTAERDQARGDLLGAKRALEHLRERYAPDAEEEGWDAFLAFVRDPAVDTLFLCVSEGGRVFQVDVSRFRDLLPTDLTAMMTERDQARAVIAAVHTVIGEAPESDDDTLAETVATMLRELREYAEETRAILSRIADLCHADLSSPASIESKSERSLAWSVLRAMGAAQTPTTEAQPSDLSGLAARETQAPNLALGMARHARIRAELTGSQVATTYANAMDQIHGFDSRLPAKPEPVTMSRVATIDPGEGWRLLRDGEVIEEGDEVCFDEDDWFGSADVGLIHLGEDDPPDMVRRRRIATPLPAEPPAYPPSGAAEPIAASEHAPTGPRCSECGRVMPDDVLPSCNACAVRAASEEPGADVLVRLEPEPEARPVLPDPMDPAERMGLIRAQMTGGRS